MIGGLVKWAWAAASLQGFRTRQLRLEWHALQGCQIGGLPMMRWLQMTWLELRPVTAAANAPAYAAPPFMPAGVVFSEAEFEDRLERIDEAVARMLWDPTLRAGLPSWFDQR